MRRLLSLLAALTMLPAAQAAAAPPTVISFEGLAQFQQIGDQYAGQGVRFGSSSSFGLTPPQSLDCGGGQAVSPGIAGTSNQIACATGSNEFPDRRFATTIKFDTERRQVEFDLQQRITGAPITATVRALGIGRNVLSTQTVSLPQNATRHVTIARGSSEIAYVQVYGLLDYSDNGNLLLDDLVAQLDDVPPPPKWALGLQTPTLDVVEGARVDAKVVVQRFNGSSGPVTLSVPTRPEGIAGITYSANPVTGTDPVDLRITAARPLTGERDLTVNATGGGGAGTGVITTATQRVVGQPAVQIASGGRFTRSLVAGCGAQRFAESFSVRGGYSDTVRLNPSGNGARAVPGSAFAAGDGSYEYGLDVNPGAPGTVQTVTLRTDPTNATPATLDVGFRTVATAVRAVDTPAPFKPRMGGSGSLRIFGTFPAVCNYQVLDGYNRPLTIARTSTEAPGGGSEDTFVVTLPEDIAPGPLRLMNGTTELARTQPLDVREFRNTFALRQLNGRGGEGSPSYTWEEFQRVFGTNNTEICFIACVRDPVAAWQWDDLRDSVRAYKGLCAGYAQMAMRFAGSVTGLRPQTFDPNVSRAWNLTDFTDLRPLKMAVVRYYTAQRDRDHQERIIEARKRAPAAEWAEIKRAIALGGVYISIRNDSGGHAVVGTDWQEVTNPKTGQVELKVAVADSNQPFTAPDPANPAAPWEGNTLTQRDAARTGSVITIRQDGSWEGPASVGWKGPNDKLAVSRDIPDDTPELTTLLSGVFLDFAGPAEVTGIESGGKPALAADFEGRPGSGVEYAPYDSGAGADRAWRLDRGRAYDVEVTGTGDGEFRQSAVGSGNTAGVTASLGRGRKGVVSVQSGKAAVGYDGPGAEATYEVNQKAGKATRSATVAMGPDGQVALDRGGLTVRSTGGATTAAVTLSSAGTALPSSATTSVRVGAGQRVTLAPRSWKDVGRAVRVTVRNRKGKVLRRGRARLRTTRVVSLKGVRARRKGSTVTVTGRVGKRGTAPLLLAAAGKRAATLRGGQVKAGRFSLTIRRAPRGRRVVVKLLDEGANLAGVTKTVRAR